MNQIKFNHLVTLYIKLVAANIIKDSYNDGPTKFLPIDHFNLLREKLKLISIKKAEKEAELQVIEEKVKNLFQTHIPHLILRINSPVTLTQTI